MTAPNGSYIHESVIRVRYVETDRMGVVYNSNYLIWFEIGRVELMRSLGFSYRDLESNDYHLPVVEARCRYKHPAFYDDAIAIRTRINRLRSSMIEFGYEIVRQDDGLLLAVGESTHIVVSGIKKMKVRLPEQYLQPLQKAFAGSNPAQ